MIVYSSVGCILWFTSKGPYSTMSACGGFTRLILLRLLLPEKGQINYSSNPGVSLGFWSVKELRCGLENFNLAHNLQQHFKTTPKKIQSKSKPCGGFQNAALIPYCLFSMGLLLLCWNSGPGTCGNGHIFCFGCPSPISSTLA